MKIVQHCARFLSINERAVQRERFQRFFVRLFKVCLYREGLVCILSLHKALHKHINLAKRHWLHTTLWVSPHVPPLGVSALPPDWRLRASSSWTRLQVASSMMGGFAP